MAYSSMLTSNLNKLKGLTTQERWWLVQAALLLPLIHYALLVVGYQRLRRVMEKLIPLKPIGRPVSDTEVLQRGKEITRIISIAAQYGIYRASCLRRSLLIWGFLRREGVQSQICFGARMIARQLEAHAWVEFRGIVINDSSKVYEGYIAFREVLPPTQTGL